MLRAFRTAVALLLGTAMVACAGCRSEGRSALSGPTIVVLNQAPNPALHFVDIATGEEVARVKLRSSAIDMDVGAGMVVTAQCGGVGDDADDVVGVFDAKRGGRVRYFKSPAPNPSDATMVSSATAVVSNGWIDDKGILISLVDVRRRKVVREGRVPDMTNAPALVGGTLWAHSINVEGTRRQLRSIDATTLASVVVTEGPSAPVFVVGDPQDPRRMFTIRMWDQNAVPRQVELHRFDGSAKSLEGTGTTYEFDDGPGRSAMIGDVLAIADFTDVEPANHGKRVLLLRPGVSDEVRTVSIPGGPAALCVWNGEFIVLESRTGQILAIDPVTAAKRRIGAVEGSDRMLVDMAVLP